VQWHGIQFKTSTGLEMWNFHHQFRFS
jgi:hypothetical protein